jgi:hypothetical protein
MRALSASQLLEVWERGYGRAPAEQALVLLSAACADLLPDGLAGLSIGQRDARLLTLREWTFGTHLEGLVTCPVCAERLELDLQTADLRASEAESSRTGPFSLKAAGYAVQFRLPNSTDLAAGAGDGDALRLRNHILERCLISARRKNRDIPLAELPDEVVQAIVECMAKADPQADVTLSVTCPACGHIWQAIFDIVTFFWREITAWSYRSLREVHLLASAYGWREADILALSPWRRHCYLEMAGT